MNIMRPGFTLVNTFPPDETFIQMTEFQGRILVCTSRGLYRLEGDKLIPVPIEIKSNNEGTK